MNVEMIIGHHMSSIVFGGTMVPNKVRLYPPFGVAIYIRNRILLGKKLYQYRELYRNSLLDYPCEPVKGFRCCSVLVSRPG